MVWSRYPEFSLGYELFQNFSLTLQEIPEVTRFGRGRLRLRDGTDVLSGLIVEIKKKKIKGVLQHPPANGRHTRPGKRGDPEGLLGGGLEHDLGPWKRAAWSRAEGDKVRAGLGLCLFVCFAVLLACRSWLHTLYGDSE